MRTGMLSLSLLLAALAANANTGPDCAKQRKLSGYRVDIAVCYDAADRAVSATLKSDDVGGVEKTMTAAEMAKLGVVFGTDGIARPEFNDFMPFVEKRGEERIAVTIDYLFMLNDALAADRRMSAAPAARRECARTISHANVAVCVDESGTALGASLASSSWAWFDSKDIYAQGYVLTAGGLLPVSFLRDGEPPRNFWTSFQSFSNDKYNFFFNRVVLSDPGNELIKTLYSHMRSNEVQKRVAAALERR
ncbi:MAG: hypothetical protein ACHQ49_07030 [Elusimicrobiota bacterium]